MRKAVRRATPRPVKQVKRVVKHPVRTTVRAATPKPIRRAERQLFNVTHPVNTLENAIIDTVMPRGKARPKSRSGSSARSGGGRAAAPGTAVQRQPWPGSTRAPSTGQRSGQAAQERAGMAAHIQQFEAGVLSRHLGTFKAAEAPPVAPVQTPQPGRVREELALRAGIPGLEKELAPFGSPPAAPVTKPPEVAQTAARLYEAAIADVSRFRIGERRRLKTSTEEQARAEVELKTRELADLRERQQAEINDKAQRLTELRQQVEARVAVWVEEQRQLAEAQHARAVAEAEAWSARLAASDLTTVAEALGPGTLGQHVQVSAVQGSMVDLLVRMAKPEGWLPVQEATLTAAGRPTLKKRSATSLNVLYGGALASEVLRLVKLTFTRAPSIATVRISVVQSGVDTPIFRGRFDRDRPAAWDTGSTNRETLLEAISTADEVRINNHNRTHEFKPIAPEASPSSGARSSATPQRQVRQTQTRADASAQPGGRQQLVDVLARSSDGDERYDAIRALRENSGPELHDVYVATVNDSDKYVRRVAVRALKDLSDPVDVPRFVGLLHDADEDIRYEAINALRDQPSADLRDVFRASLADSDRYVRRVAAQALWRLEDPRDTATFVELAEDPDEDIRYEAMCALRDRVSRTCTRCSWQSSTMATGTSAGRLFRR